MKKKIIIGLVIILLILLFPIRFVLKDGGTKKYKSLLYEVIDYHQLDSNYLSGFKTGLRINVCGLKVYEKIAAENPDNKKLVKVDDKIYYEVEERREDFNNCSATSDSLDSNYYGFIDSYVDISKVPKNNNQANFAGNLLYQKLNKDVLKICPDDNSTWYFKTTTKENLDFDNLANGNLDINSDEVQSLYKMVNPSDDATILKGLYKNEFSNDYILSVAISNLIWDRDLKDEEYILASDVLEYVKKIFGDEVQINHQDVKVLTTDAFLRGICGYNYLPNAKLYELINGCGGNEYEFFRRQLIDAKKDGEYIYLKEKSIYFYNNWNDFVSRIYVYNDYERKGLLDYIEVDSTIDYPIVLDDYIDQASTYTYIFKKHNNRYIFEKLRREN